MRQGQQNRRGRGRNNNNNNSGRKHQNPLTRTFESSGPDVKIRGTPAHVAEKYVTLARDALSSGDPVLAENYLQHAEHYNRIIMSYREQQAQQQAEQPRARHDNDQPQQTNDGGEQGEDMSTANGAQPNGSGADQDDAPTRANATTASDDDAGDGSERPRRQPRGRNPRGRRPRPERTASGPDDAGGEDTGEQPSFLTRPIKRPRRSEASDEASASEPQDAPAAPVDQPVD